MKNTCLLLGLIFSVSTLFGQTDINDARSNFAVGATVTIKGVAADGGELGPIRYIQDGTGGIPVYGGSQIGSVNRGDSVTVTGDLKDFSGLLEVDPITNIVNHGQGTQIAPLNINISDIGEAYEGQLVQIDDVTFLDDGSTFANATNYDFTDGTDNSQIRINSGTNMSGNTIPSGAQTVFGLVSEYNGDYQLLPRDMNDIIAYSPPLKKLEVLVNGTSVLNGTTINIGTTASTTITLKNLGTNNLTVSSTSFSGTAAGDFTTTLAGGAIAGASDQDGAIDFSTTSTGSRIATLEIASDDPDHPIFTIQLYGIGTDNLATEPVTGATNLTFSNVEAYTLNVGYTTTTDAEEYLIVWSKSGAPTTDPSDGSSYLRGDVIGNGQVAYVGNAGSILPRGIRANIDYYFKVYAMNGYGNFVNYNQSAVIDGNQTSLGSDIGNYYQGISATDTDLIDELTAKINPHTVSSYFLYKTKMMDAFEIKDTINGESYVTCVYTGERKVFSGAFDWTALSYSREHTYAHSWMPTNPANGFPNEPEYEDYHNLYPTNLYEANTPRSNYPFGEVESNVLQSYLLGKIGDDANGNRVYEPRDDQKGNLARAIFYMATAYNGSDGTGDDWSIPSSQDQEILKEWHFGDLPDSYEIARHELIYSIQNNRNPYIDSVDFACYVDFSSMAYNAGECGDLGLSEEFVESNLSVFPNPSNETVNVQLNGVDIESIQVTDMTGRTVGTFTSASAKNYVTIPVTGLNKGTYLLNIQTKRGNLVRRISVN